MTATAELLDRLLAARGGAPQDLARRIVREGLPWDAWAERFRAAYVDRPERAERAAAHLAEAAASEGQTALLGRIEGQRAVALHRTGSPGEAADRYLAAAAQLEAAGEGDTAAHARLLAVDALAHAGRLDEALDLSDAVAAVLRGARHRLRRALLRGNRANALRLVGRLQEAARESEASARQLEALGERGNAAAATLNAGVSWMYAGHLEKAARRLTTAHERFVQLGQPDRALDARYDLACLAVRAGRLGEAVRELSALAGLLHERGLERRAGLARMDLADALRRIGDDEGARDEAQAAATAFEALGAAGEAAEARLLVALADVARDAPEADAAVAAARAAAGQGGREEIALRADHLADVRRLAQGGSPDPRTLERRIARASELGLDEVADETRLLAMERLLVRGEPTPARERLAADGLRRRAHPFVAARAAALDAEALAALGHDAAALRGLRAVTARLDAWSSDLPGGWLATAFLVRHAQAHLTLVERLLARGRPADRAEAVTVLDGLARRAFDAGTARPRRTGLDALRQRLESIYATLAGGGGARGLGLAARPGLVAEARSLERTLLERMREQERTLGTSSAAAHAAPANRAFAVAVHLWHHDRHLHATARTREGTVLPRATLADTRTLRRHADALRFHAERVRQMGSMAARDAVDEELAALGRLVLEPLLDVLGHMPTSWAWIPDPHAAHLPLEFLPLADGEALASHSATMRLPALHLAPRRRTAGRGAAAVLVGAQDLPGAQAEAAAVTSAPPLEPSRAALTRALVRARVVHVAGHGYTPDDAPALGGVRLADGWFTAADLPARVGADLVVLAACRSGAAVPTPRVPVGGLPRALLVAGARRVLWTAADVDDATSAALMAAFHGYRATLGVARAFGQALADVRRAEGTVARCLPFRCSGFAP